MTIHPREMDRLYTDLVWTWPIISPWTDYIEETITFVNQINAVSSRHVRAVLNLGCGGGHNDKTLKTSFQVTGVDLSEEMLTLARSLNPECTYHHGDMRTVRLEAEFDAVVVFDSLAHMLSEHDLRAAFETAFVHLKPGGVFCAYREFAPERFIQNATRTSVHHADGIEIVLIENNYDPDPHDSTFENIMVYLIRRGGTIEIETDCGLIGLFPLDTWTRLLADVGFELVHSDQNSDDCDTFLCVKP